MRTAEEWHGEKPDTSIPPRVRVRVFDRCAGYCMGPCGRKVRAGECWELDHIVALINGGEHRENNLQVLCIECHSEKTGDDVSEKSKTYRMRAKHLGVPLKRKRRW